MASLRLRNDTGLLFFDFRWQGKRFRAQTELPDTSENRNTLEPKFKQVNEAIRRGTSQLATFFPDLATTTPPPAAVQHPQPLSPPTAAAVAAAAAITPKFTVFAEQWFGEFKVGWRKSYVITVRGILDQHLLPRFGSLQVGSVTRAQILELRSHLSSLRGRRPGTSLSPARINTIMLILRQILQDAADRYEFTMPMGRLKPLEIPRSHVDPFTLDQAELLINKVRKDYQRYMKVRFFTGMRSGELHGLKWKYIDFERRLILVREAIVGGEEEYTKNDFSQRDIQMPQPVYDALREQHKLTGHMDYVFCNRAGEPIDTNNFTKRVWYPLLRHLGLSLRRPYQTRHTAATLWLAAGETPEWIAKQLGHASTEMLFRVYSRFVPNLTRRDGSALDRLLSSRFGGGDGAEKSAKGDGPTVPPHPLDRGSQSDPPGAQPR